MSSILTVSTSNQAGSEEIQDPLILYWYNQKYNLFNGPSFRNAHTGSISHICTLLEIGKVDSFGNVSPLEIGNRLVHIRKPTLANT